MCQAAAFTRPGCPFAPNQSQRVYPRKSGMIHGYVEQLSLKWVQAEKIEVQRGTHNSFIYRFE